jgi:hypothetical protein
MSMIGEMQRRFVESARRQVAPQIQAAVVHLSEAHDYARQTCCDLWEFAIEIDTLAALGLSRDDLRWLVASGCAECGREITKRGDTARSFRPVSNFRFTEKTCFIVTDAGLRLTATMPVQLAVRRAA